MIAVAVTSIPASHATNYVDSGFLAEKVNDGELPPLEQRLPLHPAVAQLRNGLQAGVHGGTLRMLMAKSKDTRIMMVYGYARLVGYDEQLNLEADILESYEVKDGREFTFHLRPGHRWSDGTPFTSDDFRYFWEDIANNDELYPFGPPAELMVDSELPAFEVIDEWTVRYTWSRPNPFFLPALAAPSPLFIYAPGHYLRQFHGDYADPDKLAAMVEEAGTRNWAGLHHRRYHPYKYDNPDLPMLQPWINTTQPPAERFVFNRNPYYHRIDANGSQLPYIDQVTMQITSSSLIAAKTSSGESDLQGRYVRLDDYTFLKTGESRGNYTVRLWQNGSGSQYALYPNLNSNDSVWRELVRQKEFRRALSVAINRHEINQVIYFGLAQETGNTVLPSCPLFRKPYQQRWTMYDVELANALLDNLGLVRRDKRGIRLMPDGRPLEVIVQSAGEGSEEADILELIAESWQQIGVKLYSKPSQREVFRERVFSGEAMMAMFNGIDNGIPTADMSPEEFAPTDQTQYQWPKWGQYFDTHQQVGEAPDIPEAEQLLQLYFNWSAAAAREDREAIWHQMLDIYSEQVFSIGLVCGVPQPVVVNNHLRNVPEQAIYAWAPTAFFGVYRPDTFWFE